MGGLKFLADENMSPVLIQILRKLGAGFIESMHSKPERGSMDEHWIPLYAERGYITISLDRKQLKQGAVIQVLVSSGARMIYLPQRFADSKRWDQALWLLRFWRRIVERAGSMDPSGEVVIFRWDGAAITHQQAR